jgi:hypothetical protein
MKKALLLVTVIICALSSGCALAPYAPLRPGDEGLRFLALRTGESQIERGRPVAFVDGMGHYVFSLPSKLLLLEWRVDNHRISRETEAMVREYLKVNNMPNVKVRLNQYAPGGEWSRLARNKGVPAFWRYTAGAVSVIYYTILPGRVFGGDHYNPYTNTLHVYSDLESVALHEAAHAKDFARRSRGFRGFYSLLRLFPLVTLYQEAIASGDAIGYLRYKQNLVDEKNAYTELYPAFGSYMGGSVLNFVRPDVWVQYATIYGTAWFMKGVGAIKASTRK